MSQYSEIDRSIIDCIRNRQGAHPLYDRHVNREADRLAMLTGREAFRIIDGRLQALRKQGAIKYCSIVRAWIFTEAA